MRAESSWLFASRWSGTGGLGRRNKGSKWQHRPPPTVTRLRNFVVLIHIQAAAAAIGVEGSSFWWIISRGVFTVDKRAGLILGWMLEVNGRNLCRRCGADCSISGAGRRLTAEASLVHSSTPPLPLALVLIVPVSAESDRTVCICSFPLCIFKMQQELMLSKLICSPCMVVPVPGESSLVPCPAAPEHR